MFASTMPLRRPTIAAFLMALLGSIWSFASDSIIHNDTVWRDTAGNEIWCNGGHMIREGDRFYWVGYDTGPGRVLSRRMRRQSGRLIARTITG
jgi:hypothetical protein